MGAIKESITPIGIGLYASIVEPNTVMVRPDEILKEKGIPVTQENCAAVYASIAMSITEHGMTPLLVECPDVPSNVQFLAGKW